MIANGPSSFLLGDRQTYDRACFRSLLAFVSHRILKGGPRLLLHLALCLAGIILLTRLLPHRVSDVTFGSTYSDLVRWEKNKADQDQQGEGVGGGLRIVVFGENGITIPARPEEEDQPKPGKGWTEVLCAELNCSRYLSLVPTLKSPHRSMVSNDLFAAAVEEAIVNSQSSEPPGPDYSFVNEQYPVSPDLPDLASQVSTFLSMPAPSKPPRETLWVFNFGFWDVWSLAALPRDVSHKSIDKMAQEVFVAVERLYQASLDEKSIAHSDYYGKTTPVPPLNLNSTYRRTTDPSIEPFRVVIPQIFDPSLTPAWARARPPLIKPHSKAEQLRNAASLTQRWNQGATNAMEEWIKTKDNQGSEQEPGNDEGINHKVPPKISRDVGEEKQQQHQEETQPSPPLPLRDGISYNLPHYVIPMIVERHFQTMGMEDATGIGSNATAAEFLEVQAPCIETPYNITSDESSVVVDVEETNNPNKNEDGDEEKRDTDAGTNEISKRSSDLREVLDGMSFGSRLGRRRVGECENPDDYLFHDDFTLSQRAIENIARQTTEMVRWNISTRAFWNSIGKPVNQKRTAGPWSG